MYKSIFQSETFLDYQREMLVHIETHKDQDYLIVSVEGVLPGIKEYLTKQTDTIENQKRMLIKIDKDVIDLKETIQSDNSNEKFEI